MQDLRAVIGKPDHFVTPLLDLSHAGIDLDELSLTKRAPVRRAIEEKHKAFLSHEVGELTRFAELIEPGTDIRRLRSNCRPEVFRGARGRKAKQQHC